jgi:prophage regulatory protein
MATQTYPTITIMRRRQVELRCGLSRSTIYDRIKKGTFPAPISLGDGDCPPVGWIESEISAWLTSQFEKSRKDAGAALSELAGKS